MENTNKTASYSAYLVKAILDFARSRGAKVEKLYKELMSSPGMLKDENSPIPIPLVNKAWDEIARQLEDPFLGLHFGESFAKQAEGHFIFTLMKNSKNLEKALQSMFRYHNLMTDLVQPRLRVKDTDAIIDWEEPGAVRHLSESVLGLMAMVLRQMTNSEIEMKAVFFSHELPRKSEEYKRIFTIEPEFNSGSNGLVFHKKELKRGFPLAHGEFESYLRHYAETVEQRYYKESSYSEKIMTMIKQALLSGDDYSLKAMAIKFDMSTRHLQNKLEAEGVQYRAVLDRAREEIAKHLLKQKDVLLCDVAFMLGYSEQSSFNHAFKKWTGVTPGEFRRV
ncbi:MAG: AraC family transcriptional regulator [bacterium]|nr:AraC family transcriptional regulator [bacterium]